MSPTNTDLHQAEQIGEILATCKANGETLKEMKQGCSDHGKRIARLEKFAIGVAALGIPGSAGIGAWLKGMI